MPPVPGSQIGDVVEPGTCSLDTLATAADRMEASPGVVKTGGGAVGARKGDSEGCFWNRGALLAADSCI